MATLTQSHGSGETSLTSLAVFGGQPAFSEPLHVGRPNIGNRQHLLKRINNILDSRWLTNDGRNANEFERRIAELIGVEHCVAMCNATVALEIAIRALGMTGEVIVPSFTFIATAHVLEWQGITPVFCDIDPNTYNIDARLIEQLITRRTTGIIPVHIYGRPCDVATLDNIATRRGLKLLYDSAHAFGCSYRRRMIGGYGDAEVFSFHATKFINTMEGGAVVTNDAELAEKIRLMKNFGFAGYDEVVCTGTNGKMSEVSAALGLTNLESLNEFIATNRRHYRQYREELTGLRGIKLMPYDETERCNFQYIVIELDDSKAGLSRDELRQVLWAENVLARRYFHPGCHRMEPYRSYFPQAGSLLPETERLAEQVLVLPTGTAVNSDDITKLCGIIRTSVSNGAQVRELLNCLQRKEMVAVSRS